MTRRLFLKLLPMLSALAMPLPNPGPASVAPLQRGKVVGFFDENGTTRIPVTFTFPKGALPILTCSPTGGYFTVSKFECGALSPTEGYVSAQGEPNTPCAFNWTAVV